MLLAQLQSELKRALRNKKFLFITVLFPLVLYILLTKGLGNNNIGGTSFPIYNLISMTVFGVFSISLNTLSSQIALERRLHWSEYLKTTPLPPWIYLIAKLLVQLILSSIVIIIMYITAYLIFNIPTTIIETLVSALFILIGSLVFLSIGLLLGLLVKFEYAQTISSLLFITLSVLGGIFQPIDLLPAAFKKIAFWLPTYQVAELAREAITSTDIAYIHFVFIVSYVFIFWILSALCYRKHTR